MTLPPPVPEIPAANVSKAVAYYIEALGFTLDWANDEDGIAGISRENCRLFITGPSFRESRGNLGPTLFWLNLEHKAEVDELYEEWIAKGARVVFELEDKAWMMREFTITDLDGNIIRVFNDFRADLLQSKSC